MRSREWDRIELSFYIDFAHKRMGRKRRDGSGKNDGLLTLWSFFLRMSRPSNGLKGRFRCDESSGCCCCCGLSKVACISAGMSEQSSIS